MLKASRTAGYSKVSSRAKRFASIGACVGVGAAVLFAAQPAFAHPGDHDGGNGGANGGANAGGRGGFAVTCDFSHSSRTDPIVMPGMTNMSHLHEFFGNTTTDQNSTGATLLAGSTTCSDSNDLSAYWVPALFQGGLRVEPVAARVRYNGGPGVTAFPAGFMAVSGRTDQTAAWACATAGGQPTFSGSIATVPTCTGGSHLLAQITFPQCWDGSSLDSSDHSSHLVFATEVAGQAPVCPAGHAVLVPQVTISVEYPAAATGGAGVQLSSGAASTLHADMFEAWSGTSLQNRLTRGGGQGRQGGQFGQGGPGGPGGQGGPRPEGGRPARV